MKTADWIPPNTIYIFNPDIWRVWLPKEPMFPDSPIRHIVVNGFSLPVPSKAVAVDFKTFDLPKLVKEIDRVLGEFEAEEKQLAEQKRVQEEQKLAARRALFVPGTRVYYVESGSGNRRYGVVSAGVGPREPKKTNDDPLRVYAYWTGETYPQWMNTSLVFLAGSL